VDHGAGGIGDGLLGLLSVARLSADNPDVPVEYRVSETAEPWVRLFTGYAHLGRHTRAHSEAMLVGARQLNAGYTIENENRYKIPRWERYSRNIGASGVLIPPLREADVVRAAGTDLAGRVCLFPFSTDRAREWSLQHWLMLEDMLLRAGYQTAVFHTNEDKVRRFRGDRVAGQTPERVAGVILNSHCSIGTDSGLSHLSGILGVPTIILGGSTPVEQIFGVYPRVTCVQGGLSCSGCCGFGVDERCPASCSNLQSISPDRVLDEVEQLSPRPVPRRTTALSMLEPFRAYTPADDDEQRRHLDRDTWLYKPGRRKYLCSVLGAVHEELELDRPDLARLVREAVCMARRLNDFGVSQEKLDWDSPPKFVGD
jgi:hypothetical protein